MSQTDIMIVEDDFALREALRDTLELAGYGVVEAADGVEALELLKRHPVGLVISDVQMPKLDGLTLLERIKAQDSDTLVLLMTAYGTVQKAVQAMQAGAVDYLVKPFEVDTLIGQVTKHLGSPKQEECPSHVVEDSEMKKLFATTAKVAKSDVNVLLQGESGTGKEVLARYIHENSMVHRGPFVAINCAAIPEHMLEATLFGYEKGAFTGAVQAMPGKFEQAQGGSLLLDEISEMDLALQAKLLRVLQEREVERLGGRRPIKLDVRVIATTNRNLKEQVEKGRFREDLYYRLSVFPLWIPPLRERRADILPLAESLLRRHWRSGKTLPRFDAAAKARLESYAWPGNVRELDNVIQRAVILHTGDWLRAEDLVFEEVHGHGASEPSGSVEPCQRRLQDEKRSAEEQMILETLTEAHGCRQAAAERLGISPRTLRYKIARMKEAGIDVPC